MGSQLIEQFNAVEYIKAHGIKAFNKKMKESREANPLFRLQVKGLDFTSLKMNLTGIILSNAVIENCSLRGMEIKYGHFEGARIVGKTDLTGCTFIEPYLTGAHIGLHAITDKTVWSRPHLDKRTYMPPLLSQLIINQLLEAFLVGKLFTEDKPKKPEERCQKPDRRAEAEVEAKPDNNQDSKEKKHHKHRGGRRHHKNTAVAAAKPAEQPMPLPPAAPAEAKSAEVPPATQPATKPQAEA